MMQKLCGRRSFLAEVAVLFLLSFGLPALGEWGRSDGRLRGFEALFGAILALTHPSGEEGARLILLGMSAQSNLFFVWAWFSLAFPPRRSRRRDEVALLAWGLFSLALVLMPLLCVGPRNLLVGYYVWVLAIGLLTARLWCVGRGKGLAEPGTSPDRSGL
jgi:hypothetical protein